MLPVVHVVIAPDSFMGSLTAEAAARPSPTASPGCVRASSWCSARLAVTGEGSLDEQTLHGKAPAEVAAHALGEVEPDPARCVAEAATLLGELAGRVVVGHLPAR